MGWYEQTMDMCFPKEWKVPEVTFLKIFAAPMCIPNNRNYGKKGDARKREHNRSAKRPPEEIRKDQEAVLGYYENEAAKWESKEQTLKLRLRDLSDKLLETMSNENDFAKKNSSYKPGDYLRFFKDAKETGWNFDKVSDLYGVMLEKVFCGVTDTTAAQRQAGMEKRFHNELEKGNISLPNADKVYARMGKYLCSLLVLDAVKAAGEKEQEAEDLVEELFGCVSSCSGATKSVMTLGSVTLQGYQFVALCSAVLASDLDLETLEMIYEILISVRKKAERQMDPDIRLLVERYIGALKAFGQKTAEAMARDWSNEALADEMTRARTLIKVCETWLQ